MLASYVLALAASATAVGQTANVTYTATWTDGLAYPGRLEAAAGDGFYVTDLPSGQIVELDSMGTAVATYAIPEGPLDVAVHPTNGHVYVSRADGVVAIYDASFTFLGASLTVPPPTVLTGPGDLAIDAATGETYVADLAGNQIVVFDAAETVVRAWGLTGNGNGDFHAPQAMALDPLTNHVVVVDVDNFRGQVFTTTGMFVAKFGYRTLYTPSTEVAWFARSGGVAVDECSNIYVTDALMGTLRAFDADGDELDPTFTPLVGYGAGAGLLRVPNGLLLVDGQLLIANTNNGSVEVYAVACSAAMRGGPEAVAEKRAAGEEALKADRLRKRSHDRIHSPDNPFSIVEAMRIGQYQASLDVNLDRRLDMSDLELAVEAFGAGKVEDFLSETKAAEAGLYEAPHVIDLPYACGRCHAMDGLPGGMLSAAGQENLCLSCHSGAGIALDAWVGGSMTGESHPWGIPADSGGALGPEPDSELALHLDNGNIRCATCHHPHESYQGACRDGLCVGGDYFGQRCTTNAGCRTEFLRTQGSSVNLCGECHKEYDEWLMAGHGDPTAEAFVHYDWAQGSRAACRQCHTGNGFIDYAKGRAPAQQNGAFRVVDCLVCHSTHGTRQDEELLRVYDEVTLPTEGPDETLTGLGGMATCMTCHNGRRAPDDGSLTPHYLLGGMMFEGLNGEDFGNTSLTNSAHTGLITCMTCHMAPTPVAGSPGAGKVGGHTFNLKVHDPDDPDYGFENVANACQGCHTGLTTLNRPAIGDFDGDGVIEGVQDETQGLMDLVREALEAKGAIYLGSYPYWGLTGVDPADMALVRAGIWNWEYVSNSGD